MSNNLRFFLTVAIGAVIGAVINELLYRAGAPDWLTQVLPMGLEPPFALDLVVCRLTLGATLNMSFGSVIGMVVAVVFIHKRM